MRQPFSKSALNILLTVPLSVQIFLKEFVSDTLHIQLTISTFFSLGSSTDASFDTSVYHFIFCIMVVKGII